MTARCAKALRALLETSLAAEGTELSGADRISFVGAHQFMDRSVEIVALWRPCDLPAAVQDRVVFSRTLKYTMRAFNETEANTENIEEHRAHVLDSDLLFLALCSAVEGCANSVVADDVECIGHALFCLDPLSHSVRHSNSHTRPTSSADGSSGSKTIIFLEGVCTDPEFHGAGVGRALLRPILTAIVAPTAAGQAFELIQKVAGFREDGPAYLALRTQSSAVLWMVHTLLLSCACDAQRAGCGLVYPPSLATLAGTQSGARPPGGDTCPLAAQLVEAYYGMRGAALFDAGRGVFLGLYSPHHVQCFSGKKAADVARGNQGRNQLPPQEPRGDVATCAPKTHDPFVSKQVLASVVETVMSVSDGDAFLAMFRLR